MELISVKILLKQAYAAHLAKVRSLESELRELKEKLLHSSKSDKTECTQCKEMQKTLDTCKQEHAAALKDQQTKLECLAQKLILMENRIPSSIVSGNTFVKQDATKSHKFQFESSGRTDVLTNINTNIILPEENSVHSKPNKSKVAKVGNEGLHSGETNTNLHKRTDVTSYPVVPTKSKAIVPSPNQKDLFSGLQNSSLDYSDDDSFEVLVPETLDTLDKVPNEDCDKKKLKKKESNALNGKSAGTSIAVDVGKENIFDEAKFSSSERRLSGKRSSNSSEDCQTMKKCKSGNSEKTKTAKNSCDKTNSLVAKVRNTDIFCGIKDSSNTSKLENLSNFSVNSSFFNFINSEECQSVNGKSCGDINLRTTNLSLAEVRDSSSCSNKGNPCNVDELENLSSININSAFFEIDSRILDQKSQSVLNNNKKSNSKPLTPAIEISHDDDADFQTSVGGNLKKENGDAGPWKTSKKNSKKSSSSKAIKTSTRLKMTLEAPSMNFKKPKFKQTKLSKSIFQPGHASSTKNLVSAEKKLVSEVEEDDSNSKSSLTEDKSNCKESEKSMNELNETLTPKVSGGTWDGGTMSFSEMDKLKNMTIDLDVTFAPGVVTQQHSNDSVPDVHGVPDEIKGTFGQNDDFVSISNEDGDSSSDFVDHLNGQKMLHEEASKTDTGQPNMYHVEQYPKNLPKPPLSKNGKQGCSSFDRVPSPEMPSYKFKNDPIRNKDKRKQLKGFDCKDCEQYYSALGLSDKEKKERLKQCSRHRATYVPSGTPEHFWEIGFPDTQECKARGYLGDTQKVSLKSRRRRPLK